MTNTSKKAKIIAFSDRNILWVSSIVLILFSIGSYLISINYGNINHIENIAYGIMCGLSLPVLWWIIYEFVKKPILKISYLVIIVPITFLLILLVSNDYFYLSIALVINAVIHLILHFTTNSFVFEVSIEIFLALILIKKFRRLYLLHSGEILAQKQLHDTLYSRFNKFNKTIDNKIKEKEDILKKTDDTLKKAMIIAFGEESYSTVIKQFESKDATNKPNLSDAFYSNVFNTLKTNYPNTNKDLLLDAETIINEHSNQKGSDLFQLNHFKQIKSNNNQFSILLATSNKNNDSIQKNKNYILDCQVKVWKLHKLKKDKKENSDKIYFNKELENLKTDIDTNNNLQINIQKQLDLAEKMLIDIEKKQIPNMNETIDIFFQNLILLQNQDSKMVQ